MKGRDYLKSDDPVLEKIINTIPIPQVDSTQNVFHDLMSCVIEQQIHYRSTKKTFEKMLTKAELTELSIHNFDQFEAKAFENVKLSERKYQTIVGVVEYWQSHTTDWKSLSDKAVRQELSSIKGIGAWTIDMILLFTLQRPNIFPADDYHLKMLMTSLYQLNPKSRLKAQMKEIATTWSPHQSLAVHYLLDWKTYNKGIKNSKK